MFASIKISVVDFSTELSRSSFSINPIDSKLLHEPLTKDMLTHEPYTPESADSHSPVVLSDDKDRKNSVSPDQLKDKLEQIILKELKKSPRLMTRSASESVETMKCKGGFFRSRAMSEVAKTTRARLIPTAKAGSLQRLQSHHSSSDEEWFEFINDITPAKKSFDDFTECSDEIVPNEEAPSTNAANDTIPDEVPNITDKKNKIMKTCRLKIKSTQEKHNDCCSVS